MFIPVTGRIHLKVTELMRYYLKAIVILLLIYTFSITVIRAADDTKDPWPLTVKDNLNVAIIGTYGEYRLPGHFHLAIDIQSKIGEPVYNNRDGILLECVKIHNRAGYRIVIGDLTTLEGREFTHVDPTRKILNLEPGKSLIKKGELLGHVADYSNDKEDWNDHLHYAYVRIKRAVNRDGDAQNVIEGLEHPLNRLEITPEIAKVLRDAPPQLVEPIMFIPDGGKKGDFKDNVIFGNVDILVHAFDRMGRSWGLGPHSPAPYEFEWRIVEPSQCEGVGGKLVMDGRLPLIRPVSNANYVIDEKILGDFIFIITNRMTENGYWMTNESRSNPGYPAVTNSDARYPDGKYTIEVIIREHPALGKQRESRFTAVTYIDNFPGE
jgi:hypothetical protein